MASLGHNELTDVFSQSKLNVHENPVIVTQVGWMDLENLTVIAGLLSGKLQINLVTRFLPTPRLWTIIGVKQWTFQWLISIYIAYKDMGFNGLVIHHLIMITRISYEIIFTISLPKLINIAPL